MKKHVKKWLRYPLQGVLMVLSLLLIWYVVLWWFQPPEWLFPAPGQVWNRFTELWSARAFQPHFKVTFIEITIGYWIGITFAFLTGYPISQLRPLERLVTPYLIAANSVPLVALAPLLLLWFGNGIQTKIIVTALIVYFPATISTMTGFQQQSPLLVRLMNSLGASKWQRFWKLELPSAVPGILAGMKIGAPLAVVGAVVGEFLGTGEGLGHLILEANGLLDTPQMFAVTLVLGLLGTGFYALVLLLERSLIGPWHRKRRRH